LEQGGNVGETMWKEWNQKNWPSGLKHSREDRRKDGTHEYWTSGSQETREDAHISRIHHTLRIRRRRVS